MVNIPPEILPILASLNIQEPTECRWKHLDIPSPARLRSHHFCPCGTRPDGQQKLELAFTWMGGRSIFIGQCGWCMTIYWRDAILGGRR